ncbi:MAG: hypothetical protein PHE52_00620 [Candidatus Pacebacteria bacterium]|nr:hypothetical protein [Candidatus Paceibacterota bacterium]
MQENNKVICDFSFRHYEEILKLALKKGYRFLSFRENSKKYKKIIYLRHDIDISPDNAIKLARIENKYGIKATYLYLLHDIFYNVLENKVLRDIKEINKLGHQIGLHFDFDLINNKSKIKNPKRMINEDLSLFKNILGRDINIVSFHNPSVSRLAVGNIKSENFINVYADEYTKNIKYLSDSLQVWKEGCLCRIIEKEKYDKMHFLIHPFLWNKKSSSLPVISDDYIFHKCYRMNEYLKKCSKFYQRKWFLKNQCPLWKK